MTEKTAFAAIVGVPSVGKSSIMNVILGQKIAIVSPKPQTTRTGIMGVLTKGSTQIVFVDTPGFHRPINKLGEKMMAAVNEGMAGADVAVLVTDSLSSLNSDEKKLLNKILFSNLPCIVAINKIDLIKDKTALLSKMSEIGEYSDKITIIPISAKNGDGMNDFEQELFSFAKESPHFFPDDTLTDQPERVLASEFIREKALFFLDKEIPHGIAIGIEKFKEREDKDLIDIDCVIYCEKESHKGIIIGKNGLMLKKISTEARKTLEGFFGIKVNLKCWVKVKPDWRNREALIHNFGLS